MSDMAAKHTRDSAQFDAATIDLQLREALLARAERLGIDPSTIASPSPRTLVARTPDGTLLRLDVSTYGPAELER